jgi:hypothetical protein
MPSAARPSSRFGRTAVLTHPADSRSAAPTPLATSPLRAPSRVPTNAASGPAVRPQPLPSARPPLPPCPGPTAPAPQSAYGRRSLRNGLPGRPHSQPRSAFAARSLPAMPIAAGSGRRGALADAPSAARVDGTPVASNSLNVWPASALDQYLRLKYAPASIAARVGAPAPVPADMRVNRSVVRDFAADARTARSSLAGRNSARKKCSLGITLAGSPTTSGSGGFRLRTRSR